MDSIIAAVIASIMSPLMLAWLQHKIVWRAQKRDEIKMDAFINTLTAFSSKESDASDVELQSQKKEYKGQPIKVDFRPETIIVLRKARGMVKVFFSKDTFDKVDRAMKAQISFDDYPPIEFYERCDIAISAMAKELGINAGLWDDIKTRFPLARTL